MAVGLRVLAEICRDSGAADEDIIAMPDGFVLVKLNIMIPMGIVLSAAYYKHIRRAISQLIWKDVLELGVGRAMLADYVMELPLYESLPRPTFSSN